MKKEARTMTVRYEAIVSAVLEENKAGWMVYFVSPNEAENCESFYRNKSDAEWDALKWEKFNNK
jgi:hypothetical protein